MRLLLYLPTPGGVTGTPRRLLTLSKVLCERGFEVLLASSDEETELLIKAREFGLHALSVPLLSVLKVRGGVLLGGGFLFRLHAGLALLFQNIRFLRQVKLSDADAIWIRASKGIAFAGLGAVLSRRPLIWDVDYELPSRGRVHWLHRFGLWAAHAVVFQYRAAPSSIFGRELADRYCDKFIAITPGVNLSILDSFRAVRQHRKRKDDDPFVILQVGTICDRKNQMLLLEALHHIKHEGLSRKLRLIFAGGASDQEYVEKVEFFIAEKGLGTMVEFLGWRDDVHALMAEADILVMPSKDEGVPNAIQEAMYIGLPVMVSEVGGMSEIVSNGKTGWVLPMDAPDQWCEKIRACIEDGRECDRVSKDAALYAMNNFGADDWGKQYGEIITRAVLS